MAGIMLRSPSFHDHDLMPERLSRAGGNLAPSLEWADVPPEAAELVLLCEDPDAPSGTFLHWLVTGIDPATGGFGEGEKPAGGREWRNDFGAVGWGGPQPPRGDDPHRYFFRLYALPDRPRLPVKPSADDVHRAVDGHELASGTLVGRFAR